MTFEASNSRIKVTDTNNQVVFDTDENMPHIVGTQYIANVSVSYPNIPSSQVYHMTLPYYTYYCPPAYLVIEPVYPPCETGYVFAYDCSPNYCGPDVFYCPEYCYSYFYTTYYCPPSYINQYYVTPPCVTETFYSDTYQAQYAATEYSATQILANYPTDENGANVDVDFIIVQASGSRTVAGQDTIIGQSLLTTVPGGTFSFQGSVLLESAGLADGKSYLRRILSLFLDNTNKKVVLKKQASTRVATTGQASEPSMASTFNFNFKIFFGRFKS